MNELERWLLGDAPGPSEPLPLHQALLLLQRYQQANNTRWVASRDLRIARDLGDEELARQALAMGRKARAVMDDALGGLVEVWGRLGPEERASLPLPVELREFLEGSYAKADGAG